MRFFSILLSVCALLLAVSRPVWAENLAVILGDRRSPFPSEDRQQISTIEDSLRGAGFRIFSTRNRSLRDMRGTLGAARGYMASSEVEHVVVVVAGPFASRGGKIWALSDGARRVSDQNIASVGLPLREIENALNEAKGNKAVLLGLGYSHPAVIPPLQAGIGFSGRTGDRLMAAGSVPALRQLVRNGLLDEDVSMRALQGLQPTLRWLTMPRRVGAPFLSSGSGDAWQGGAQTGADMSAAEERGFWRAVRVLGSKEAYAAYLETYPRGTYRDAARARLQDIEDAPRRQAEAGETALGLSRSDRRDVQRHLTALGYNVGPIDGIFGRGTRGILRKWQAAEGFEATGYLTDAQLRRLQAQAAKIERQRRAEEEQRRLREDDRDRAFWRATGSSGDADDLRLYLERFPKGIYADRARAALGEFDRAEEGALWRQVQAADSIEAYEAFLQRYPDGRFADDAKARLRQLRRDYVDPRALARDKQEEEVVLDRKLSRIFLEQQLYVMGLNPGLVDGKVDAATRRAVKAFQLARDMPATGYVGRETFNRIMNGR